jgi:hypothetical protein
MNDTSHSFLADTNMSSNEYYFFVWTRFKEIEQEWMIFKLYRWELKKIKVHKCEQTILRYLHFW